MGDFSAGYAGGYAKGILRNNENLIRRRSQALQEQAMILDQVNKTNAHNRAMQELGIRQEDLNMRKQAFNSEMNEKERKKQIDKGLGEALSTGGYTAGIEFLKANDPRSAIDFHSKKLSLDEQLLKNDVMQAVAPLEKNKAMFATYGLMGKLGAGIEQLPEEERGRAWELARPMITKVWPDAPEKYNKDASLALKLSMAQGTPENMLFASEQKVMKAQTSIMKAHGDLQKAMALGNPSMIQDAKLKLDQERNKLAVDSAENTAAKLRVAKTGLQIKGIIQKDIDQYSKPFLESMEAFSPVIDTLAVLEKNPQNSNARAMLLYKTARLAEPNGPLVKDDLIRTSGAAGYTKVSTNIDSFLSGKNVALSEMEKTQIIEMLKVYLKSTAEIQEHREKLFEEKLMRDSDSDLVSMEEIRKPSEVYKHLWQKAFEEDRYSQVVSKLPKEKQEAAAAALEQVKDDPKKLEVLMKRFQADIQGPQQ